MICGISMTEVEVKQETVVSNLLIDIQIPTETACRWAIFTRKPELHGATKCCNIAFKF
jgi:hypothetical protein